MNTVKRPICRLRFFTCRIKRFLQFNTGQTVFIGYFPCYRCFFGMGSVQAWRFTQRLAGIVWAALGLILAIIAMVNVGKLVETELMDSMFLAGKFILGQAATVFVSVLCINAVVFARYDRKGIRRASWKELLGRDE